MRYLLLPFIRLGKVFDLTLCYLNDVCNIILSGEV
jgi:hypothetical protein